MGSRSTFTNSKGVKKSGEHRSICQNVKPDADA